MSRAMGWLWVYLAFAASSVWCQAAFPDNMHIGTKSSHVTSGSTSDHILMRSRAVSLAEARSAFDPAGASVPQLSASHPRRCCCRTRRCIVFIAYRKAILRIPRAPR
jgi:hypothetical protein